MEKTPSKGYFEGLKGGKYKGKEGKTLTDRIAGFWNKYGDWLVASPIPFSSSFDILVKRFVLKQPGRVETDKILKEHKRLLLKRFEKAREEGLPGVQYQSAIRKVDSVINGLHSRPQSSPSSITYLSNYKRNKMQFNKMINVLGRIERERNKEKPGFLKRAA